MQKIINQILEGNFDYEDSSLDFSCTKIELSLKKGERYEGSFRILSSPGRFLSGMVISSDLRMECLTSEFVGGDEEISFCFHGENMEEGEVAKGNFYVISNQGEYYLPFVVSIEHTVLESSVGTVKNLFHFANLAKSSWQEAVALFYSPEFPRIFQGSDAAAYEDYRALSAVDGQEQNVEEFLIQMNKKQKVEFLAEESGIEIAISAVGSAESVLERELSIVRNGWGYTCLYLECEGDFLFTEKQMLTDDDFLGNHCELPVFVDTSLCRPGRNFGRLFLYNSYASLEIPVTVSVGQNHAADAVEEQRNTLRLMELYQEFRTKKINTAVWLKETKKIVERLVARNENDIAARLFQAQVLITEESVNEAGWILDHVSELLERGQGDDTLLSYYLYLTTLLHGDAPYVRHVTAQVERIYRQDNSNWRVAWLLLYLSEEYHRSVTSRWVFLEKQFEIGCHSPVLYLEALTLVNNNPALLRHLDSFEQQVLWYGTKRDILKPEVVEQLLYLTGKLKEYRPVVFSILKSLYKKDRDERILQEICTLLIKGGKAGGRYFEWYRAGVEKQLRITNLYEYFMMSVDLDGFCEIPKTVLMYFSYRNSLDYEQTAYLYAYLYRNADRYEELFGKSRERMEAFCLEQIQRLHINRQLSVLYQGLLKPEMITEETADALARLLFAHRVRVADERIKTVYVYQQGGLYPEHYAIAGGETWISLYGSDYTLVFEDGYGNRFVKSVEYDLEKMMVPGRFLRMILPKAKNCPRLDLYLSREEKENPEEKEEYFARMRRLLNSDYPDDGVRRELVLKLSEAYYESDRMRELGDYLQTLQPELFAAGERSSILRYMVLCGLLDKAGEWLHRYGPYGIEIKVLLRLVSGLMEKNGMEEDPILTAAAVRCFKRRKYDSTILSYLSLYYRGMTKHMRNVWKAAKSFKLDCYALCEAILVQMLYSGAFVGEKSEIFHDYIAQGAKPEVEAAFLAQCAYGYFVKNRVTENDVFREILSLHERGEAVPKVCKLAFLKYYAEMRKERTEEVLGLADIFLRELMEEGIRLDFFREYTQNAEVMREMADKTIVTYYANRRGRACIHYVIIYESGDSGEYVSEYMKDAYGGVCFKEFVLFFGEGLQYYITEELDGEEQLTESQIVQKSEASESGMDGRYQLVNDIVISRTMEDYDTMEELMEEYAKKEFMNRKLFALR